MKERTYEEELRAIKRRTYIPFAILVFLVVCLILAACVWKYQHTFTTEKWLENPGERTKIVDNLLENHALVGMTQEEILTLLGEDDAEYGYFSEENQWVYYMGMERGLISIDSEWLLLNFQDGVVTACDITTD